MVSIQNTLVTLITVYIGFFAAKIVVNLTAILTIYGGWKLYSKDRNPGSKYFKNLTMRQKIGIFVMTIGALPFADVIVAAFAYVFAGSLFD